MKEVLVVEDEVLVGMMLARRLRTAGYTVGDVATSGEEALRRAKEESPNVILMDITLSGELDGIEAAAEIKRELDIPVIIFTGYDEKLIDQQTRVLNPFAVISKMAPFSSVTKAIEKALA